MFPYRGYESTSESSKRSYPRISAAAPQPKSPMKAITRSETHRIGTLAVRTILVELPADWSIRGLEERDYGIDLHIEIFDRDKPTGRIAHIQVKGLLAHFSRGNIKLARFPTRTLEYALRFSAPFFLFFTSIKAKTTYFVWLQKYASSKLNSETPDWRDQDWITIYFPNGNTLHQNHQKITDILRVEQLRDDGIRYLAAYEWLKLHVGHGLSGSSVALEQALESISLMEDLSDFIAHYGQSLVDLDLKYLKESINDHTANRNVANATEQIREQLQYLYNLKMLFLDKDEMDEFTVQSCSPDGHPY